MRTVSISGLALFAAVTFGALPAAQAQTRIISVGHHGATHAPRQHHGVRHHDTQHHGHRGEHKLVGRFAPRYGAFERRSVAPVLQPTPVVSAAVPDDGISRIRAVFNGPLGAGATAAATYVLMTHGPKAFGLEDEYRRALADAMPAESARIPRAEAAHPGPKFIRIGD